MIRQLAPGKKVDSYRSWGIRAPEHHAYILSDAWKQIREAKYREVGRKCQDCGERKGRLECHHLTYERFGYELLSDLRILCQPCHASRHNGKFARRLRRRQEARKRLRAQRLAAGELQTLLADARQRCNQRRRREAHSKRVAQFWG